MPTLLPPVDWTQTCRDPAPAPAPAPVAPLAEVPPVSIDTVGDYLDAHGLDLMISIPGLRELPIDAVQVEHDSVAQLTYISQQGSLIGSASWPTPQDGPEVYAGRGQRLAAQPDRGGA